MLKMLFFDYRDFEMVERFTRVVRSPLKYESNPALVSDYPIEANWMSLYGSVIRRPENRLWQMCYTVRPPNGGMRPCLCRKQPRRGLALATTRRCPEQRPEDTLRTRSGASRSNGDPRRVRATSEMEVQASHWRNTIGSNLCLSQQGRHPLAPGSRESGRWRQCRLPDEPASST